MNRFGTSVRQVDNTMFNTENCVCHLMAIDPGSSSLGVAVYEIHLNTLAIISSTAFTLTANQSNHYLKEHSKMYGDKMARLNSLQADLSELFDYYRPALVVCESPFFNRFTPNAYAILTEMVNLIKYTLFQFNNHIPFFTVDPPTAKKAIGAKGNAKKDEMTLAIDDIRHMLKLKNNPFDLDEHSIDALAIGYFGWKKYIEEYRLC